MSFGRPSCFEVHPESQSEAGMECRGASQSPSNLAKPTRERPLLQKKSPPVVADPSSMEDTVTVVKTVDGQFICPVCRAFFSTHSAAMRHFESVHSKMVFVCNVWTKFEVSRKDNLKRHIMNKHQVSPHTAAVMTGTAVCRQPAS